MAMRTNAASKNPTLKQTKKTRSELTEEQRQEIKDAFDLFDIEGTGLGLFIVKKYTELLNGEISFKSEESHGTTFEIILPKNHLEK